MDFKKSKTSISWGIFANYFRIAVLLLLSLFYPPFLLSQVHKVDNGILSFAISLLQVVTLLSLGVENSYVRFATKKEKERGEEGLSKINGSYFVLFSVVSVLILLFGTVLAFLYKNGVLRIEEVPSSSFDLVFWVILITAFSSSISFFFSLFMWFEVYRSRFLLHQIAMLLMKVLTIGCACLSLLFGGGILWVSFATLIVEIFYGLFNFVFSKKALHMSISFEPIKELKKDMREILGFSIFIFLMLVVSQIENNAGRIILSNTLGATSVTVFSYGLEFYTYAALLSKGVSDTFSPKMNALIVKGEAKEADKTFLRASFLQMSILLLLVGGFAVVGRDFLALWLSNGGLSDAEFHQIYWIALLNLLLWCIPLSQSVGVEIQRASNKHKFLSFSLFVLALLSLPISILLTLYLPESYRIYGPLIGNAFFVVLGYWILSNVYYKKVLSLSIGSYFLDFGMVFLFAFLSALVPFLLFSFIPALGNLNLWANLFIKGFVYLFFFLLFFLLFYRKRIASFRDERKLRGSP